MSNVAPKWFEKAIANKPDVLSVKIKGTKISIMPGATNQNRA